MINKKWLTEVGYETGFQIVQPQFPILPQVSNAGQVNLTPVPANFTASVPGGITNQLSTITIQGRDSNNQSVTIGGNVVFVTVTGSNSTSSLATDNGNGTYTFTYTPTIAGQDSISITADGIAISGSPYTSVIISATAITKQNLLSYLQGLPSKNSNRVLSASLLATYKSNVAPWTNGSGYGQFMDPVNFLFNQTGKYPAMIGQDWGPNTGNASYVPPTDANSFALSYWQAGGLNLAHCFWSNPWTGGGNGDVTVTTTFHDVVTPGTAANTAFMAQVSTLADKFAALQANGVVVIFRPLPEVNGSWFWWGGGAAGRTANDIILLHQQIHDYIQNTRGLTNVIWVYNAFAKIGNYTTYYPGSSYVDIASFDYYGNNNGSGGTTYNLATDGAAVYAALTALSPAKIIAISETGPYVSFTVSSPNTFDYTTVINTIRGSMPQIVYYMVWDSLDRYDVQNNSIGVMTDPWIIDRSEVSISLPTPTLVFSTEPSGTPIAGSPFATNPIIQLQDGAGHNISSAGVSIVLTPSNPNIALAVTPTPLVTDSTGKAATTSIIPTGTVGTYTMTAAATGYASAISTSFTLFPGTINPAHCTAVFSGNTQNQPISITVQARDTWDNALTVGGATVVVHVTGANTASPIVTDNGNGTYSATYTPANTGTDTIAITANGTSISGSPFSRSIISASTTPNLPPGFVFESSRSWDAANENGWSENGTLSASGNYQIVTGGTTNNFGIAVPLDHNGQATKMGQFTFPTGYGNSFSNGAGAAPGLTFIGVAGKKQRYVRMWARTSSNFEMHPIGMKLILPWVEGGAKAIYEFQGNGGVTMGQVSANIQNNVVPSGGAKVPGGPQQSNNVWHMLEFLVNAGTPGQTNGFIKCYIDGTLVTQITGIEWSTNSSGLCDTETEIVPVWGGGIFAVPATQCLFVDDLVMYASAT